MSYLLVFFLVGIVTYSRIRIASNNRTFRPNIRNFRQFSGQFHVPTIDRLLSAHLPFYANLPPKSKQKFLQRTRELTEEKYFAGRQGLSVSNEMIILLCGVLTKLTFGFRNYKITGFNYFVIFPGTFYSKFLEREVKGLTIGTGFVYLSWTDVMDGINSPTNGVNLALHEMAHALYIDYFRSKPNLTGYSDFLDIALNEIDSMRSREKVPFLRHYAAENTAEFFAVCVEYFFEKPISFKQNRPLLYQELVKLLNQDPALLKIDMD